MHMLQFIHDTIHSIMEIFPENIGEYQQNLV